jgi:hypothetical protein
VAITIPGIDVGAHADEDLSNGRLPLVLLPPSHLPLLLPLLLLPPLLQGLLLGTSAREKRTRITSKKIFYIQSRSPRRYISFCSQQKAPRVAACSRNIRYLLSYSTTLLAVHEDTPDLKY